MHLTCRRSHASSLRCASPSVSNTRARAFAGWQSQPDGRGVQDALERALAAIADAPVRAIAAGRTDAGVHATMQIVHFDVGAARPDTAWVRGVNAHLPADVAVLWMRPVAPDFHARNAAEARHYTYVLANRPVRPALLAGRVGWYHRTLDVAAMTQAAQALVGTSRFFRVPRRRVPGEVADEDLDRGDDCPRRRSAAVRFPRRCVPPAHDPQHRRVARLCRRGQARPGVDRRAPRGPRSHARRADVRARRALFHRRRVRREMGASADAPARCAAARRARGNRDDANARQDLRHHPARRRSRRRARRRRRDRLHLLGGHAATDRRGRRARDRSRAAALRHDRRLVRRSRSRGSARNARRCPARSAAVPRQRAAGALPRVRAPLREGGRRSGRGRRRTVC